jgi:aminopeptidase N
MFNPGVYSRGALTLHALRLLVGDAQFFSILRTYYARHAGSTANTTDFIDVAEEISNRQLEDFFDAWLYAEETPALPEAGG